MNKKQANLLAEKIKSESEFDHTEIIHYTDTDTYAVSVGELHGKRFDSPEAWSLWVDERDRNAELYR